MADEEENYVEEPAPKEEASGDAPSKWAFPQRGVLWTDGVSGVAEADQAAAYDNADLAADQHAANIDKDFLPLKDRNEAERKRREAGPDYDR